MNPSTQEKSVEEIPQETNEKITTENDHNSNQENQKQQVEEFFSDSEEEDSQNSYKYEKILSHKTNNDGSTSYLVKLQNRSYHNLEWILETEVLNQNNGDELLSTYRLLYPKGSDPPALPYDQKYLEIEKIITFRQENDGNKVYLTKWCNLDYRNLTWEPESAIPQNIINDFHKMNQIPDFKEQFIKRKIDYSVWKPLAVSDFTPKQYQIEGLKFITHSFCNGQNVILSEQPNLSSSIQCSMFLKWLTSNENNQGPFLIIATEERIEEWKEALEKLQFGPVLTFLKPKVQRDTIAEYELFYSGTNLPKMNLILSNFSIQVHNKILSEISWTSIFVDIAHFKDSEEMDKCLTKDFFNLLGKFESSFTLLITQIPFTDLNLLKNCFSILFKNLAQVTLEFTQKLDEPTQSIIYKSSLRSILLKQTDVDNTNHQVTEYIINCGLTEIQLDLIQSIYQKYITYIVSKSNGILIKSIFKDLNLICTHPYLHEGAEMNIIISKKFSDFNGEINQSAADFSNKNLIESSSKMKFLQKIVNYIKNVKRKNHRLIICSHHEDVLDIVQEYFEYENIFFERLSNLNRGDERNKSIQKFNMIGSIDFSFLINLENGAAGIKLNNVDDVVLIDSGWNPEKDVECIMHLTNSTDLKIYRLLSTQTVEHLMYHRALLKFMYPNLDKLNVNNELVSLLGFGIDLHESVEYKNDSIEEILDRSIRNYYSASNDEYLSNSSLSFFTSNSEIKNDPWLQIVPYTINESYVSETPANSRFSLPSSTFWTTERLTSLLNGLVRFGWGRWSTIYKKFNEELNGALDFELNALCHIFLKILLKSTKNNYPIASLLCQQPLQPPAAKYEEKFKKENQELTADIFAKNCETKLSRIEFMYFINVLVVTCPHPPEDIVVPYIESSFDNSWNEEADRQLIFHVYNNGFMCFGSSTINTGLLEVRVKQLIQTLKERYLMFREMKNSSAQFEHFSLIRAVNMLTREEQQLYVQFLIYYGWTTAEDFKMITGSYRTPKELNVIHKVITGFCSGSKAMINDLAESIPSNIAKLILTREKLLANVRNNLKKEDVLKPDWPIIEHIIKNGFIGLDTCDEVRQKFGTNSTTLEYQVSNFLLQYIHNIQLYHTKDLTFNVQKGQVIRYDENEEHEKHNLGNSPHLKNKAVSQVNIEYDKDGNPVMPIQITPSLSIVNLGEIITDRPNFFNGRYIYPKNFTSLKMYRSTINPNDKVWYKSSIIDDNTDSPLFRVEMKDNPNICFDGRNPSKPWLEVLKVVNDKKKEIGLQMSKIVSVSGPEYFGLAAPVVQALIQKLKGADICLNYNSSNGISHNNSSTILTISEQSSSNAININSSINNSSSNSKELAALNSIFSDNMSTDNSEASEINEPSENNNEDENGMLKIVPRKRNKKISYAESTSSTTSSSDSESDDVFKNEKDKDFNAENANDEDDENEPFDIDDDDEDSAIVDEPDEKDLVEIKRTPSRSSRTNSNNSSHVVVSARITPNNSGASTGITPEEDRCIIA